jgi:DNA/RNA endonuclease YhcR with UshA esterase domain
MLVRQERIAIVLLCAVSVTIIAASVILTGMDKADLASEYTPLSDEGTLVHLQGQVQEIRSTKTGGHIAATVNGTTVFIPADVAGTITLHPGDQVFLYGIVQTYRGEKEVVVNSPGDILITDIP